MPSGQTRRLSSFSKFISIVCLGRKDPDLETLSSKGVPYPGELLLAAEIYKRALLTFLHTTFYGPRVTELLLRSWVGAVIVQAIPLFAQMETWLTLDSHGRTREPAITTTFLWPLTIIRSCLANLEHRKYLRRMLSNSQYEMQSLSQVLRLLNWLWEDPSGYEYGPYELEMVMKNKGAIICIG
ncbi:hypothetical protein DL95DRAFT_524899 [Leptodontidium sp. 2 PMI_412]|nr:hypothetical protein DL95DRAFT_524899 [Leptodontidium sp. 2 PMI_412]